MTLVYCSIPEQFVNPLFEVFDGGDLILSSYRAVEASLTDVQIYFPEAQRLDEARKALGEALELVGVKAELKVREVPDDDWVYAYRRHFTTERASEHIVVHPEWEALPATKPGEIVISLDPGLAFGTGKHETTKACLKLIDKVRTREGSRVDSFLDMGCGSGILAIAAKKLGFGQVTGFDVDAEAVAAAVANASKNAVAAAFFKYGLGSKTRRELPKADLVAANILGPLLIKFAGEIVPTVGKYLIISGILTEIYPEVKATFEALGLKELENLTIGEWTTGLLTSTAGL